MIAVLQPNLCTPLQSVADVGHIAVYDNDETLLAVMWERDDGTVALTRAGENDFERLCRDMHLDKRPNVRCVSV